MRMTVVPTTIGFANVRNCCVRFLRVSETKTSKRSLQSNRQIAETKYVHKSPPVRGDLRRTGKSPFAQDCVVEPNDYHPLARALSTEERPNWRYCVASALSLRRLNCRESLAPSSLPQKFHFLARRFDDYCPEAQATGAAATIPPAGR